MASRRQQLSLLESAILVEIPEPCHSQSWRSRLACPLSYIGWQSARSRNADDSTTVRPA